VPTPLPLVLTPGKRFIFLSCPSLIKIKCILIVQGGFALALQVCMYHTFIKLPPSLPLPTHSLSPYSPNIHSLLYCALYYIHIYMSYFNIFHSLTFSFSLQPPIAPTRHTH
jgi:hypothetical protein